jgi:hypothetical protein
MSIIGTGFDQYKVISKDEYEILKVMELWTNYLGYVGFATPPTPYSNLFVANAAMNMSIPKIGSPIL